MALITWKKWSTTQVPIGVDTLNYNHGNGAWYKGFQTDKSVVSGKHYIEIYINTGAPSGAFFGVGVHSAGTTFNTGVNYGRSPSTTEYSYMGNGLKYHLQTNSLNYGASYTTGDTIGIL